MFAKETKYYTAQLALVKMTASEVPAAFPLISDEIDNIERGIKLAPGSSVYVTGSGQLFMLGEHGDWTEQ